MMNEKNDAMLSELARCRAEIDQRLAEFFTEDKSYSALLESMRYSLLSGGKRIRAVLCMKFCEAVGGDPGAALDVACAIEMLHAYTLIHDDLPCMDDDDMRRGKPSNHIEFGEFTATLAGDALQAAAFDTILSSNLPPDAVVIMARILAVAAGPHGICGGQYLDLAGEGKGLSINELTEIYFLKTSALIAASAILGVVAAGGDEGQIEAADEYACAVGLAFQVRDDVLDSTSTADVLGKPIGSDSVNKKTTFASLLGVDACEKLIEIETEKAIAALDGKFDDAGFLVWLANYLSKREK